MKKLLLATVLAGICWWCYEAYQPFKQTRERIRKGPNYQLYKQMVKEDSSAGIIDRFYYAD